MAASARGRSAPASAWRSSGGYTGAPAEALACWRRTCWADSGKSLAVALLGILGAATVQLGTLPWHPLTRLATLAFELLSVVDGLRAVPPAWGGRRLAAEGTRAPVGES
jgi:hypothetical protein